MAGFGAIAVLVTASAPRRGLLTKEPKLPSAPMLAELFLAEHPLLAWRQSGYLRTGGVAWPKIEGARGRHMISRMIDGLAEQPVAHPRLVSDVWQAVLDRAWIDGGKIPPCWLNGCTDRDLHVFTNGILNIRTSILEPHDPAFFNLTACDFPYVPGSTCPKMDKWIAWFASDNPKLVDLLWEIYAWVMCPSLRLQKYIVMVGGGDNGKQCYLKVLTKLVGGNIAAIPLEQFGVRFTSSALLGKACNVVGDLNELDRISEGHLKMYVDNSEVWCEEKFKPGSTAVLDTRFIFSTNKMIPLSGKTHGDWRRPVVIPCRAFVSEAEKIRGFEETLYDEMPGVLNRVLQAAQRLIARGDFDLPECCLEESAKYRRELDTGADFCGSCMMLSTGDFSPSIDIYHAYRGWCISRGRIPCGYPSFWQSFNRVWKKEIGEKTIYYTKKEQEKAETVAYRSGKRIRITKYRTPGWAGIRSFDCDCELVVEEEETTPLAPKPVEPVRCTAPAVIYHFPVIDRLRDALAAVEEIDVDRLLDELLEEDVSAVPIQELPLAVECDLLRVHEAEVAAINAEKKVTELKLKIRKAERKAKELAEKAELQRKRAVSGSTATVPDSRHGASLPVNARSVQSPMLDELNT